jgi:hypothetical protein
MEGVQHFVMLAAWAADIEIIEKAYPPKTESSRSENRFLNRERTKAVLPH